MYSGPPSATAIITMLRCAKICKHTQQARTCDSKEKTKSYYNVIVCLTKKIGSNNIALFLFLQLQNMEKLK